MISLLLFYYRGLVLAGRFKYKSGCSAGKKQRNDQPIAIIFTLLSTHTPKTQRVFQIIGTSQAMRSKNIIS